MAKHKTAAAGRSSQSAAREVAGRTYFETVRRMSDDPKLRLAVDKAEAEWDRKTSESDESR